MVSFFVIAHTVSPTQATSRSIVHGSAVAVGCGAQRTPFSDVGAPVFCARERLGLGMAAGRNTSCGDELLLIRMESSGLHAYIEARAY